MEEWTQICQEILEGIKDLAPLENLTLPPLREVNHKILLINPNLTIRHQLSKCPEAFREDLMAKVKQYLKASWWEHTTLPLSMPLLIAYKKDSSMCTVIDVRQCNDNTLEDSTPMPNQEMVRSDVAKACFCSKIDLSDVYKQMRVWLEHESRMVFATIHGNMKSRIMQQGNKNGPVTFQKLMNTYLICGHDRSVHPLLPRQYFRLLRHSRRASEAPQDGI